MDLAYQYSCLISLTVADLKLTWREKSAWLTTALFACAALLLYSFALDLASGIVAFYWDMSLINWFIIHTVFEILENTKYGMHFINKYITVWPGGKPYKDSVINNVGDTIGALVGWISAFYLERAVS